MKAHNTPFSEAEQDTATLTPQQRRLRENAGTLDAYRSLVLGSKESLLTLLGYELYTMLLSGLPGALGYGARSAIFPYLLKHCGRGLKLGRSVTIRQPGRITLGRGVIIDDYAVLDIRECGNMTEGLGIEVGDNSFIGRNTIIAAKGGVIRLGAGCNISTDCRIATETNISIGESTLIAAYAYIGPGNHQRDQSGKLIVDAAMETKGGVSIGSGCWIGARATILDGVQIGDGAVIGAHSLVKDNVPAGAVAAGVPAKIIS